MLGDSRAVLGLTIVSLAVVGLGPTGDPPQGGPAAGVAQTTPTPHLRVGGRVNRHSRPAKGIVHLDAFVPGIRSAATIFLMRADKSSLLLRADADGRLTRIGLDDLY